MRELVNVNVHVHGMERIVSMLTKMCK